MTGFNTADLESRVRGYIQRHDQLSGVHKLVVGVSGGADSVCLLHVLVKLKETLGIELHVAHLDHQLRGADSAADAAYVAGLAKRHGLPSTVESFDVRSYRLRHRLSLEESAREVRYRFLGELARSVGAGAVAVGHTRDDNVETILLHIVRGTGTRGLRGLQPVSDLRLNGQRLTVVRPLLDISRDETAAYCEAMGLAPRTDASNLSPSPRRNRVRLKVLPLLRTLNTNADGALLRLAATAADELDFFDREAAKLRDTVVNQSGDTLEFRRKPFQALPPALQRHLLRTGFEELLGELKDVESRHIEEIMDALDRPAGRSVDLPGGLVFAIDYDRFLLGKDPAALCPYPALEGEFPLRIPGETIAGGWRVSAAVRPPEGIEPDEWQACLDFDEVGDRLVVRAMRPGDRFEPLGLGETKKVAAFMIDARIPRAWRARVPVVASPRHIVWLAGWRIDERSKLTPDTRRVLCLEFGRS